MWKISVYIISLLILCSPDLLLAQEQPEDSVTIPLKIKAGIDVIGPVIYLTDRNILNTEGFVAVDLNEKYALYAGGGYSDFKYSQYNYSYISRGIYFKVGIDINLLKPELT
ncbi:MAG: hypothetical protein IQL11_06215, partial [Bacteroidales bacterium]|nr:hypothetical protein [Bacteroidales bacterium]